MSFLSPKETVEAIQEKGNGKAHLTVDQDFVLAFMSGMYIGLGGLLAIMVVRLVQLSCSTVITLTFVSFILVKQGGNIPDIQQKNPGLQKLIFGTTYVFSLVSFFSFPRRMANRLTYLHIFMCNQSTNYPLIFSCVTNQQITYIFMCHNSFSVSLMFVVHTG